MVEPELGPEPEEGEEPLEPEQVKERRARALYCKYCGEGPFATMSELGVHSRKCAKRKEKEAEKAKGEPPTPYKTEVDVNSILEEILSRHPDITPKVKDEVMDWARLKGGLQPMEVQSILQSMRGITGTTAGIIANKYAFALTKAQQEGKLQLPAVFASAMPTQPQMFLPAFPSYQPQLFQQSYQPMPQPMPQPQPQAQPQPWPSQPYWQQPYPQLQQPPQPDMRSVIREELRSVDDRLRRLEEPKPKEAEGLVEIEEPIRDSEGKILIGPDERPIVKKMKVPASQAGLYAPKAEDSEFKTLEKMKLYKEIFGEKGLDESKIREVIRQEVPKGPEKPPTPEVKPEDVQRAAAEAASGAVQEFIKVHEKEDREEARFRRLEETIRSTASVKAVEGYKEDSYRILGQGLSEVASTVKERKPVEVIVREGGPLLLGAPPPKQVEKGAEEGLVEKFQKRGWIAEG